MWKPFLGVNPETSPLGALSMVQPAVNLDSVSPFLSASVCGIPDILGAGTLTARAATTSHSLRSGRERRALIIYVARP